MARHIWIGTRMPIKPKKNPVTKLVAAGVKGIITGKPKAIINGTSFTKGGKKVLATPGGKVGRAIENKARAAINMPKGITTGKAKAIKKAAAKKSGLESRGAKPTKAEAINRARDYQWNKAETYMEQRFDTMAGGPRAGGGNRGPGKKNARKTDAVSRLARQAIPVKTPKVPVKKKVK